MNGEGAVVGYVGKGQKRHLCMVRNGRWVTVCGIGGEVRCSNEPANCKSCHQEARLWQPGLLPHFEARS